MGKYFLLIFLFLYLPLEAKEAKEIKEPKEVKKVKEIKEVKETKEAKETKEDANVKIEGLIEVGIDINNKLNKNETDYNKIGYGKIDLSARPVKKIRAELGLEYDNRDSTFIIDKLYGQYGFSDFGTVRAGYTKKAFGLEEKAGVGERYFHKRSIVNDGLEELDFLGHDLTVQYRHSFGKELKLIGGFSWVDTLRCLQNYSVEYETKNNYLVLSAIIRHFNEPDKDLISTYATAFSYRRSAKLFVSELELTYGTNPRIKVLSEEDATFFGARMQEYFPIDLPIKTLRQVIPIAEAAIFSEDTDSKVYDAQLRAGLTLGFAKKSAFQWRNTYGTVLRMTDGNRELRRKRYDSEVVVVF